MAAIWSETIVAGCFVRLKGSYIEILRVIAVEDGEAWVADDEGTKLVLQVSDLERVSWSAAARYFERCDELRQPVSTASIADEIHQMHVATYGSSK